MLKTYIDRSSSSHISHMFPKRAVKEISSISKRDLQLLKHSRSSSIEHIMIENGKITYQYDIESLKNSWKYMEDSIKLLAHAFENQRKMYKYVKAWGSYQNDYISDKQMDIIEEKMTININSHIPFHTVNNMIKILFENIHEDDFDTEELSKILGVSREYVVKITAKINNELHT